MRELLLASRRSEKWMQVVDMGLLTPLLERFSLIDLDVASKSRIVLTYCMKVGYTKTRRSQGGDITAEDSCAI